MGITIGTNVWMSPGQTIPRMHPNLTNTQRESLVFPLSPRLTFSSLSREPLRPYYYIFPPVAQGPTCHCHRIRTFGQPIRGIRGAGPIRESERAESNLCPLVGRPH